MLLLNCCEDLGMTLLFILPIFIAFNHASHLVPLHFTIVYCPFIHSTSIHYFKYHTQTHIFLLGQMTQLRSHSDSNLIPSLQNADIRRRHGRLGTAVNMTRVSFLSLGLIDQRHQLGPYADEPQMPDWLCEQLQVGTPQPQ